MYRGQNHARRHDTQTGNNTNPILENCLWTESTHFGRNRPIFEGLRQLLREMCLTARVRYIMRGYGMKSHTMFV